MDQVTLARWQFGITTVYHYLFVPITIAMASLVAILQTIWYRTGNDRYLQLTKFFGKLFLINFALGVVTGIVQEFQFGMNWSEYSRFVGDIFGAPLALEALLAFFMESTFIGLWIFGWDRLPKPLHLMSIWLAAIGTAFSAAFILGANAWMQNPVGSVFNIENGRAELDGVGGFLNLWTNPVFLSSFPHTIFAAFMVGAGIVAGISFWHLARTNKRIADGDSTVAREDVDTWRWATKFGAWVLLIASLGTALTGDFLSKAMTDAQPMKMAAAEGLTETTTNAPFSVLTIGDLNGENITPIIEIPGLLSWLAGHETVEGIKDLNEKFAEEGFTRQDGSKLPLQEEVYAAIQNGEVSPELEKSYMDLNITPNIPISYWTFRLMIGVGMAGAALAAVMLLALRKKDFTPMPSKLITLNAWAIPLLPLAANAFGWIFTEMGRQPWIVAGVLPVETAVSPSVSAGSVLFSLIVFTLLYGALAVLELFLFLKFTKKGLPDVTPVELHDDPNEPVSFAY